MEEKRGENNLTADW